MKRTTIWLCLCLLIGLGFAGLAEAASATLTWDAPGPAQLPPDFKEVQVLRALQTCTAAGPFAPLIVNGVPVVITKPATGAFPTSYTDTTVPQIDGQICYRLRSLDLTGNFDDSNIGVKTVNLVPPSPLLNLSIGTVQ